MAATIAHAHTTIEHDEEQDALELLMELLADSDFDLGSDTFAANVTGDRSSEGRSPVQLTGTHDELSKIFDCLPD